MGRRWIGIRKNQERTTFGSDIVEKKNRPLKAIKPFHKTSLERFDRKIGGKESGHKSGIRLLGGLLGDVVAGIGKGGKGNAEGLSILEPLDLHSEIEPVKENWSGSPNSLG
ncbi:MAG: hypothetical protein ACJAVK_001538 [Akkermansiaceae bacterium]|jgi:hypothetical protein